jgi:Rps23 Pro-64 3,4-dihydroxylase Tpa1-like proline 4-hydroxylase
VIEFARWNLAALAEKWRTAAPFPWVTVDELVSPETLTTLSQAISEEPHWPNRGEIFDFMGSAQELQHPTLRAFQAQLGSPAGLEAVRAISGKPVGTVETRSYVYLKGSYLLPHTDCQTKLGRLVAYAFYVWTQGCTGGELELFDVTLADDGHAQSTRSGALIEPRSNRLVLFDVSPATIHQVREILDGARLSLSGWFHA